ncbi:MAG: adenylate/guanylate cyclase domain-containing protein [Paracoccaceae bacterium]
MVREDFSTIIRKIRIFSGVVLFLYVIMHLSNHSLNIFSIELADNVREKYFAVIWQHPAGLVLLYLSLFAHLILGFSSVLRRKSFKMSFKDWVQIIFPILALLFLAQHIAASFIITKIFGGSETYSLLFAAIGSGEKSAMIMDAIFYSLMIVFIWTHGVIGLDAYLKQQAVHHGKYSFYMNYPSIFKFLYWIIPTGAVLGWLSGLRDMSFIAQIKALELDITAQNYLGSIIMKHIPVEAFPVVLAIEPVVMKYYPLFILFVVLVSAFNVARARFFGHIVVNYPAGETVSIPKGTTVLEASRMGGIPHQSVCGGRGRCTTCRVKVTAHDGTLPAPNAHEIKAIERVGLDDNVRLACQLRPTNNISVQPLLNPENTLETVRSARALTGKEQETVILFVDLRDFTKLSEKKLPYDVVYILNKYYAVCGEIIEKNGGRLDKFIGDGIMAIFDVNSKTDINSRNAVISANEISKSMKVLNSELKTDFSEDMRFGMGIHAGSMIVGMMGYGKTVTETAVGDNVNIAARLEELSKTYRCELVVSKYVADKAKIDIDKLKPKLVDIRGRKEALEVFTFENAADILV